MKPALGSLFGVWLMIAVMPGVAARASGPEMAAQQTWSAQEWLAALPPLPATAQEAYALWSDLGDTLKPAAGQDRITDALKDRSESLQLPLEPAPGADRPVSEKDRALAAQISVFGDEAKVEQQLEAIHAAQLALEQRWRNESADIEVRRVQERGALPACHNDAGPPSQLAIRAVEEKYTQQKIALAEHYLVEFETVLEQLKTALRPRIVHGDTAFAAWMQLHSSGLKSQLAPLARNAESGAIEAVKTVEAFIQEVSKPAAQTIADKRALERVYAKATGC
jgi:hypothetical protein